MLHVSRLLMVTKGHMIDIRSTRSDMSWPAWRRLYTIHTKLANLQRPGEYHAVPYNIPVSLSSYDHLVILVIGPKHRD